MIAIIILAIIFIIWWLFLKIGSPVSVWKNISKFPTQKFLTDCKDEQIKLDHFIKDGNPALYSTNTQIIKLGKWGAPYPKGYMSKINLLENNTSPIMDFINNWIKSQNLPSSLISRMSKEQYSITIRICGDKWHYPNHFDALDNYMIILEGARTCKINGIKTYNLKKGDIFYIPAGAYHEFWIDSSDLNIALNINFDRPDLANKFDEKYPLQTTIQEKSYNFYNSELKG